jgi:hypothetical protein
MLAPVFLKQSPRARTRTNFFVSGFVMTEVVLSSLERHSAVEFFAPAKVVFSCGFRQ